MNNWKEMLVQGTACYFILLFGYAAWSKYGDFENFQVQLAQSPLLSAYAGYVSHAVIGVEFLIVALLVFEQSRRVGLYCSLGLMTAFTVYIFLILNFSDFVPCSCGGILEELGWTEHLIFNLASTALAAVTLFVSAPLVVKVPFTETLLFYRCGQSRVKQRIKNILVRRKLYRGRGRFPKLLKLHPVPAHRAAAVMAGIVFISGGFVVLLFLSSEHIIKKENNFTRRYLPHAATETARLNLKVNSYYFAGFAKGYVYLGNTSSPLRLRSLNLFLTKQDSLSLSAKDTATLAVVPRVQVHETGIYLYDGSTPIMYRSTGNSGVLQLISRNQAYFDQIAVIDSSRFAVRSIAGVPNAFVLGLLETGADKQIVLYDKVLQKNPRNLFENDGQLLRDDITGDILYVYSYRNTYVVMKEDFQEVREYRTIVPAPTQGIRARKMDNGEKRMEHPPPRTHLKATVHRSVLFIPSLISGRFESNSLQGNSTTIIDLYSTKEQLYVGSFYLYNVPKRKVREISVSGDRLLVLAGSDIISYHLSEAIIKHFRTGEAENLNQE